jgi:hypothetical protein
LAAVVAVLAELDLIRRDFTPADALAAARA